jgi:hypothetical protein
MGRRPSFIQAGTYGAVMKKLPINDFMTKDGMPGRYRPASPAWWAGPAAA